MKYFFLLIFLLPLATAELEITEIMYNPSSEMGSDSDLEWIELFNNGKNFNLINATLNQKLLPTINIPAQTYLILANEYQDGRDKDNLSFYSFYNLPGYDTQFSLSNTADTIELTYNNKTITTSYLDDYGADGNGFSLEKINNTWIESQELYGTPGRKNTANPNYIPRDVQLKFKKQQNYFTNVPYTNLVSLKFLRKKECTKKETVNIKYQITHNNQTTQKLHQRTNIGCSTSSKTADLIFNKPGTYTLCANATFNDINPHNNYKCQTLDVIDTSKIPCDVSINISTEKIIYQNKERISYKIEPSTKTYPFSLTYWIDDLTGTNVKSKITTTSTNKRSYTPSIKEIDRAFLIKSELHPTCNDSNKKDNHAEKLLVIINPTAEPTEKVSEESDSSIKINKLSKASFGNILKVDATIYHGSTGRYSISAYVQKSGKKISETTKINLKEKYTEYKVNLPIQLIPNCDDKVKDGSATLVIEGLGEEEKEKLTISGRNSKLCSTKTITKEVTIKQPTTTAAKTTTISPKKSKESAGTSALVVYQSSPKKAKQLLPFILIISVILCIVIVLRKA